METGAREEIMTWSEATIGIVIGSLFTTLGVILQGCISWWLEGRKHSLAQRNQAEEENRNFRREWIRKREEAYLGFADVYGFLLSSTSIAVAGGSQLIAEKFNATLVEKVAQSLTSIRLFGSDTVFLAARNFTLSFVNMLTKGDVDQNALNAIDEMLGGVVQQMNRELVKAYSEGR